MQFHKLIAPFSFEGRLFALRYSMTGTTADPKIKVNPLSAPTPGFLREIFGLGHALEGK